MVKRNLTTTMQDRLNETYDRAAETRAIDLPSPWPSLRDLDAASKELRLELERDATNCELGDELSLDQMMRLARLVGHLALAQLHGDVR